MDLKNKPKDYSVLFLDMNSYFASVEQQVQPTLRGKPIAVAPYIGGTGCCIAVSGKAKERGVRTGDLVRDAKKKCYDIKIVEARPALYQFYHREIKKVLDNNSPLSTPLSIDEFMIRLTGSDKSYYKSKKMALKIKSEILDFADSLTCSVGISSSYFLAKIAGESKKPDGLTILKLNDLGSFYKTLKLRDIPGVNFRMERQLATRGINLLSDFYQKDLVYMSQTLKHPGKVWYYRLRGYDVDRFEIKNKSCGHSHVLPPEFRTKQGALQVLEKLVYKTGYRLRRDGYLATGLAVSISFFEGEGIRDSKRFDSCNDTKSLLRYSYSIVDKYKYWPTPKYVSVTTFNLIRNKQEQISIFADIEKSKELSKATDEINDKYGAGTVINSSFLKAKNSAPDRISFGIPRYDIRNH